MKNDAPTSFVKLLGLAAITGALLTFPLNAETAAKNWEAHCAKCHGADGKGQTTMGKKLKAKDYTDAAVQAAFTDEQLLKLTVDGKDKMPAYKDKLSADEAKDLVKFIRAFKK
jgi:mono/diheme cytochrome c family protein